MFNPYIIILALFSLAGVTTIVFGVIRLQQERRRTSWPLIAGTVEKFTPSTASADMQTTIDVVFEFQEKKYKRSLILGSESTGMHYSPHSSIELRVNPATPDDVVILRDRSSSEWLVIAAGVGATIFGLTAIFTHI